MQGRFSCYLFPFSFYFAKSKLCRATHCVKSMRIRSYSGPHFPAFGLNTERYGVSLGI